jgi:hypothetical protein
MKQVVIKNKQKAGLRRRIDGYGRKQKRRLKRRVFLSSWSAWGVAAAAAGDAIGTGRSSDTPFGSSCSTNNRKKYAGHVTGTWEYQMHSKREGVEGGDSEI